MNKFWKIARFSFVLPYIVVPVAGLFMFSDDFISLLVISLLLPFGIESPIVFIYPICWILTILGFIFSFVDCKKRGDRKGKIFNLVFVSILVATSILHIVAIWMFVQAFRIPF